MSTTTPSPSPALVLVAHGSPDPDWSAPVIAVLDQVRAQLAEARPGAVIRLHLLSQGLPHFEDTVRDLARAGYREVRVVAYFLSGGGRHVKRDLPDYIEHVQRELPDISLVLDQPVLGEDPEVVTALAQATLRRAQR